MNEACSPEDPFKKMGLIKKDQACYVLITCKQPTEDGQMHVEMTYEGDPHLASYLIESAQGFINCEDEDVHEEFCN